MCPVPSHDELRRQVLQRIDPNWQCPACAHPIFIVHPELGALPRVATGAEGAHIEMASPCLQLICRRCGFVSLHAAMVVDGSLDEAIRQAEDAEG